LGAASAQSGGRTIKSSSRTINVHNIGSSSQRNSSDAGSRQSNSVRSLISPNELFMTATASKSSVYEQEAVLVTYKLYTLLNLTQLDGKLPALDGFHIQEIDLPRQKDISFWSATRGVTIIPLHGVNICFFRRRAAN
jgi:hypothetical protein